MRKLVAKVFTPRRVEELRPMVQRLVDDTLDDVPTAARWISSASSPSRFRSR